MHINPQGKVQFILVAAAHASLLIMLAAMKIQSSAHFVNARGKTQKPINFICTKSTSHFEFQLVFRFASMHFP